MKRKDFFKRLGLGAAALIVAPKVIAEALEEVKKPLPSAKVAAPWDVKRSPKVEWHEETRVHELIDGEVLFSYESKITIVTKQSPKESKFRLNDVVSIDLNSYLVTRIGEENINHTIIDLTPLVRTKELPSLWSSVKLKLMGNSYG